MSNKVNKGVSVKDEEGKKLGKMSRVYVKIKTHGRECAKIFTNFEVSRDTTILQLKKLYIEEEWIFKDYVSVGMAIGLQFVQFMRVVPWADHHMRHVKDEDTIGDIVPLPPSEFYLLNVNSGDYCTGGFMTTKIIRPSDMTEIPFEGLGFAGHETISGFKKRIERASGIPASSQRLSLAVQFSVYDYWNFASPFSESNLPTLRKIVKERFPSISASQLLKFNFARLKKIINGEEPSEDTELARSHGSLTLEIPSTGTLDFCVKKGETFDDIDKLLGPFSTHFLRQLFANQIFGEKFKDDQKAKCDIILRIPLELKGKLSDYVRGGPMSFFDRSATFILESDTRSALLFALRSHSMPLGMSSKSSTCSSAAVHESAARVYRTRNTGGVRYLLCCIARYL